MLPSRLSVPPGLFMRERAESYGLRPLHFINSYKNLERGGSAIQEKRRRGIEQESRKRHIDFCSNIRTRGWGLASQKAKYRRSMIEAIQKIDAILGAKNFLRLSEILTSHNLNVAAVMKD